jgi:endonuclease-3
MHIKSRSRRRSTTSNNCGVEVSTVLEELRAGHGSTMLGVFGKSDPWQTLIATILSARSRDETTDVVARKLFARFGDCGSLARARLPEVERLVKKSGFYRTKARRVIEVSRILVKEYGGRVPDSMEELLALPGIGRKTASCVLVYAFGKPAIPVDTHVHRISNRLGWVKTRTPEQTEEALRKAVPERDWLLINDLFVFHGKNICRPVRPLCSRCAVRAHCATGSKER